MTATLRVDELPTRFDGTAGKIVVGQIHGEDEELVRLYYENGSVYLVNDKAGDGNKETKFLLTNAQGEVPNISLGEKFSYKLEAAGDQLQVVVYADGQVYSSVTKINSVWQSDEFYFKAGVYLGVNETTGTGEGQASFYGIDFGHTPGDGLDGLLGADKAPVKTTIGGTAAADILNGTASGETIFGAAGEDKLNGNAGNDSLWGNDGNDALNGGAGDDRIQGGSGRDTYTFEANHGNDQLISFRTGEMLVFSPGLFASAQAVREAFVATAEGIKLQTGANSSITFVDAKMSDLLSAVIKIAEPTGFAAAASASSIDISEASAPKIGIGAPIHLSDKGASISLKQTATVEGGKGNDTINGSSSADFLKGGAGNDKIGGGSGDDWLLGGDGDDTMTGYLGADKMNGDTGNDVLNGGDGNDIVHGGAGIDRIVGGIGDDFLAGGLGADKLTGQEGRDTFFLATIADAGDTVTDFETGIDQLVLDSAGFGGATTVWDSEFISLHSQDATLQQTALLVFDGSTDSLYYDADGVGGAAMHLVAVVDGASISDVYAL